MYLENYKNLLAAVITTAASDYEEALKHHDQGECESLEKFFKNNWYISYLLPELSGNDIIKAIRERVNSKVKQSKVRKFYVNEKRSNI